MDILMAYGKETRFTRSLEELSFLSNGMTSGECAMNIGRHWKDFAFSCPCQEQQKGAGRESVSLCLKLIFAKLKNKYREKIFLFSIKTWGMTTMEVVRAIVDDEQCWQKKGWVYSATEQIYGGNY